MAGPMYEGFPHVHVHAALGVLLKLVLAQDVFQLPLAAVLPHGRPSRPANHEAVGCVPDTSPATHGKKTKK